MRISKERLAKHTLICLVIYPFSLLASQSALADIGSISGTRTINNDTEDYQSFSVTCRNAKTSIEITRPAGERRWCDSQIKDLCARDKVDIANRVCSRSYKSALRELKAETEKQAQINRTREKAERIEALQQERLEINNSLRDIQAKKWALEQRELKLQKQQQSLQTIPR